MNAPKYKKYLKKLLVKSFDKLRTNGKASRVGNDFMPTMADKICLLPQAVGKKACPPYRFLNPKCLLMAIGVAWGVLSMAAVSAGTLAQVPLFITASLDPNIMFIIDDSGSMNLSFLPDSLCNLGSTKRVKSSTINGLAYNPNTTYKPPVDANNVSLGDSPFTAAWQDGYALPHPTTGTPSSTGPRVNLSLNQFRPTWSGSSTGCTFNSSAVYDGTAQVAYYYKFFPPQASCSGGATGDKNDDDCYVKIVLGASATAAEKQNFANWYSYYRTRLMMAKAGASRAFAQLGTTPRVGFGRINKSTSSTIDTIPMDTIEKGVRTFSGSDRTAFFTSLFTTTASGLTPLRRALNSAGFYYSGQHTSGPWSSTPGASGGELLPCRQSYTVLMTDGYWNDAAAGTAGAKANNDGTPGTEIAGVGVPTPKYTYKEVAPFKDNVSNSLADVAMYYWKRDLCPTIDNRVPTSTLDPAFWQHMVTYGIGLGVPTAINPTTAFNAISALPPLNAIAWPNPDTANTATSPGIPARIDDLLHASVNGRGGFFNAGNPDDFADALSETLSKITDEDTSSASAVAANSTRLDTGTQVYQAKFNPQDWSGRLQAFDVDAGTPATATTPAIPATGALTDSWEASVLLPAHGSRNIYTYNPSLAAGSRGVLFQWTNLTTTPVGTSQRDYLNTLASVNDGNGALRVDWLRGNDAKEQKKPGGIFRDRTNFLGDIVNSDPAYVGAEDYGYGALSGAEGSSYSTFRASSAYASRDPMIYVGANDGMMHGFNASAASGGQEVFAYVPNALFPELSKLTSPTYAHRYYVDGASGVGDVYDGTNWHTLLAGTTGAGGRAVFALDVTDPGAFGPSSALWEFTNANDADLGYTLAQPSVVRMEDGHWAVIVANGYNSDNGHAVLFVLDAVTGAVLQKIDTLAGTAANKNGLSMPLAVDTDNDRSVDTVYAGDLYGNFWKFDVSGSAGSWPVPVSPFFVACTASGTPCAAANRQPITAKPNVGKVGAAGSDQNNVGIMVYFGTGKYFETSDNSVGISPQVQTFYGLWDKGTAITDRGSLQENTILFEAIATTVGGTASTKPIRVVSQNPMCYAVTSTGCNVSSPLKRGWALNLLSPVKGAEGERAVSFPLVRRGLVVFSSIIPDPDPCTSGGRSWLMEVDALGGGEPGGAPFDTNGNGVVDDDDYVLIAGVKHAASGVDLEIGITKTPAVIESTSTPSVDYKYLSGSSGQMGTVTDAGGGPPPCVGAGCGGGGGVGIRRSWRQLK
jgi:type IV pilus assembly protein PilY1